MRLDRTNRNTVAEGMGCVSIGLKECVLLIGRDPIAARLISKALSSASQESLEVECVGKLASGLERIGRGGVRAIIIDTEMPDGRGMATFEALFSAVPHIPILVVSAADDESGARQAVERGAQDLFSEESPGGIQIDAGSSRHGRT